MSECLFGFASKWSAMVIEFENTILDNGERILKKTKTSSISCNSPNYSVFLQSEYM